MFALVVICGSIDFPDVVGGEIDLVVADDALVGGGDDEIILDSS